MSLAPTTRLAPSPTGALHLGNARTFLITWALARQRGWRLIYRVEDLDTPRVKPGAIEAIADTLGWIGLDWDPPEPGSAPQHNPLIQSKDLEPYRHAMRSLAARGMAYPCSLTRTQIELAASAPQEGAHDIAFPLSLRPADAGQGFDFDRVEAETLRTTGEASNWRFLTPPGNVAFHDQVLGPQRFDVSQIVGDFVIWTKRGQPSYQLAVVVDDARQGVTQVVRGADLLDSTSRQLLLSRALGLSHEPAYTHLPLVLGHDGKRLAKRHGDSRIEHYRSLGVSGPRLVGLLAWWSIPGLALREITPQEFLRQFNLGTMPTLPARFGPEEDRWLVSSPTLLRPR